MSFDNILGTNNKGNKPERFTDFPQRPTPLTPDLSPTEPWFVSPEKPTNNGRSKKLVIKRVTSILFPVIGLALTGVIIAAIINFVAGIYS